MIERVLMFPFELVWYPFRFMPSHVALALFSVLTGMLILVIYRWLAPAERLRLLNDRIIAALLEVWYVRDSLILMLRAQLRIVWLSLVKMSALWKAILALGVFVVWIIVGMAPYCDWQPFATGDTAVVRFRSGGGRVLAVQPADLRMTSPMIRTQEQESVFRVQIFKSGYLDVSSGTGASPAPPGLGIVKGSQSGWGYKVPVGEFGSAGMRITHPERTWRYFGTSAHWVVWFSLFALGGASLAALVLRPRLYIT